MSTPLATVVIATHNGEAFLEATLQSVMAQSVGPLQVLVCDDGSSDGTPEMLARWSGRLSVITQQNRGVSAARNAGAARARAPFIAFLDHDDLWEPQLMERQLAALAARPDCALAYADSWIIDDSGARHGRRGQFLDYRAGNVHLDLLAGNFIPIETTVMPTAVFRALGGFRSDLCFLEDYELFLRLSQRWPVTFSAEPLARYRIHSSNLSLRREALLAEWVDLLDELQAQPDRASAERARISGERARRAGEVAWAAARRGDVGAALAWLSRAGPRCPAPLATKVRLLAGLLTHLPAPLARAALRSLPRNALYGVGGRRR